MITGYHPETMKKKTPTDATLRSDSATKHELHKLLRFFLICVNLCNLWAFFIAVPHDGMPSPGYDEIEQRYSIGGQAMPAPSLSCREPAVRLCHNSLLEVDIFQIF